MDKKFHIMHLGIRGCGKTATTDIAMQSAIIEDQIAYYKKEFAASIAESNRQCDIAAEFARKIIKLEDKLCQMKK